jgi:LacI family transcriptional regulator
LKDIAAVLGVSHVTVSLALRGSSQIPPATRERVRAAAKTLHYVPDENAQRLKTGKSGKIAFVSLRLAYAFMGQVLAGMELRAYENGRYINNILTYSTWFQISKREEILSQILYGRQADAVIMASMHPDPLLVREFKRHEVPVILIEDQAPGCWSIRVDNVHGAREATRHLIQKGCGEIGIISGEVPGPGVELNATVPERNQGWEEALREAQREPEARLRTQVKFYNFNEGRIALDILLKQSPKLDAIFCAAGDRVAMGVMERARELGLRIGQDLKLVGYDDSEASRLLDPPLSSVPQPAETLGSEAMDMALEALDHPDATPREIVHKPELVVRASAA